jgi:hypothetical protein
VADNAGDGPTTEIERCGQCGMPVQASDALCPHCGALLAAYRAPDAIPIPSPEEAAPPRPTPDLVTQNLEVTRVPGVPVDMEALKAARVTLLRTLMASQQRFIAVVEEGADTAGGELLEREATPVPTQPFVKIPSSGAAPSPKVQPRPAKPPAAAASRPRRQGFVVTSPVEPLLLMGATLFAIAVVLVICASLASLRSVAVVAFLCGTAGIFAVVLGLLAVLVQRDRRRD